MHFAHPTAKQVHTCITSKLMYVGSPALIPYWSETSLQNIDNFSTPNWRPRSYVGSTATVIEPQQQQTEMYQTLGGLKISPFSPQYSHIQTCPCRVEPGDAENREWRTMHTTVSPPPCPGRSSHRRWRWTCRTRNSKTCPLCAENIEKGLMLW